MYLSTHTHKDMQIKTKTILFTFSDEKVNK